MRQSGRTTRIVNFIVDQLYTCGQCIATDHIVFESPSRVSERNLIHLVDKVKNQVRVNSNGNLRCNYEIVRIDRSGIPMIHFELIREGDVDIEFIPIREGRTNHNF